MHVVKNSSVRTPDLMVKEYILQEVCHLILIMLTSFTISLVIGFDLELKEALLAIEFLGFTESLFYLVTRTIAIGKA